MSQTQGWKPLSQQTITSKEPPVVAFGDTISTRSPGSAVARNGARRHKGHDCGTATRAPSRANIGSSIVRSEAGPYSHGESARRREIDGQREEASLRPELLAHASHVRPGIDVKRLKRRPSRPLSGLRTGDSLTANFGKPAATTSFKPSRVLPRGISGGEARRVKLRTGTE